VLKFILLTSTLKQFCSNIRIIAPPKHNIRSSLKNKKFDFLTIFEHTCKL